MAGFGSLVPGMAPMAIPQMKNNGLQGQGMSILKAALAQQAKPGMGGMPGQPQVGQSAGPGMPMQVSPPAAPAQPPGMLGALLAKLNPQQPTGPIDPNTGLPVTQDVLNGAAGLGDMGGAGPAPTAISGLW